MWNRIKHKNDVDDVFQESKVDGERIYQPRVDAKKVRIKTHRLNLSKKFAKLNMIINLKCL